MSYDFGDIVLVPFPFTSQAASKKRPAVVVSSRVYNTSKPDIVVMAVTSQMRASAQLGEVWLGGELEIVAKFPDRDVRIRNFRDLGKREPA